MAKKTYTPHLGPREINFINALEDGPKSVRELMDVIPTNNVAEYCRRVRALGYCVHTQWVRKPDHAGEWRRYGVYHLLPDCDFESAPKDD